MPVPAERKGAKRELLRDSAYVSLRDAIVDGTLVPGEQLHDAELCDWLGLSRTPVREALHRLAEERLVESAPQRYTRVTRLTQQEAADTFAVVAVIHALATELAVPRLTHYDLAALESAQDAFVLALRSADPRGAFAADNRFHQVFVARADNAQVDSVLAHLTPAIDRLERLAIRALPAGRSVAQHQAIIERAAAGNATGAGTAVRANWLTLSALVEQSLAEPGRAPAWGRPR